MRKNNFKIQMLAGNSLKICVGASSQISTTLIRNSQHFCAKCKKGFATKSYLKEHQDTIHDGTKYSCCNRIFLSKAGVLWHIKTVHEGKKFECKICNQEFSSQGNLKTHQLGVHEKHIEKVHDRVKHVCAICDKDFQFSFGLKRHMENKHK